MRFLAVSILAFVALVAVPAEGQPDAADELIELRLIPFLEALDQPSLLQRRFIEANMTPGMIERSGIDGLLAAMAEFSEQAGTFRIVSASRDDDQLLARLEPLGTGAPMRLVLVLGPGPEYRIDDILLSFSGMDEIDLTQVTEENLTDTLSELVARRADEGFSGVVLVARRDEIVYSGAFGPADATGEDHNTLLTPFNIGSLTEILTTVMVLSLAEGRSVSLETTIGEHLPDWPDEEQRGMQLGSLLLHMSGLGPLPADRYREMMGSLDSVDDYLALARQAQRAGAPGEVFLHSEANTILLAALVERMTGRSYDELLQERVYRPAGMSRSGRFRRDELVACCAIGILHDGSDGLDLLPLRGSPGAGSYATAIDLWRFANALLQGELLSTQSYVRATTPLVVPHPAMAYGLGFGLFDHDGELYIGGSSRGPGMGAELSIYPASGYTVVVLSNIDGSARSMGIALRRVVRSLFGEAEGEG